MVFRTTLQAKILGSVTNGLRVPTATLNVRVVNTELGVYHREGSPFLWHDR
jgi:hypothetical protein